MFPRLWHRIAGAVAVPLIVAGLLVISPPTAAAQPTAQPMSLVAANVTQEVTVPAFHKQAVELSTVLIRKHHERRRLRAYRWAKTQHGKPYIWGGTGPYGYDCSGIVMVAYEHAGIQLPRTTYEMLGSWLLVPETHGEARKGDLAFFGTGHVELVAGKWMTYGALEPGTFVTWHPWSYSSGWFPTAFFRVR